MIGLASGTVHLTRFDSQWHRQFDSEARRLRKHLSPTRHTLEHIGSTAVPGLSAKPIIDMAIQIPSLKRLTFWVRRLTQAGYVYKGEYGLPGRHFFTLGTPVTHHLHLVAKDCPHWDRWILFRNYLRACPDEARRYDVMKKALAKKYARNRNAYTKAKTPLVTKLLAKAAKWAQSPPKSSG